MKRRIFSVNVMISIIIILGFSLTTLYSYLSFQKLFREDVEAVSELTSENIYVNMRNLMDRPMNVSLAMANDTFLRDFINIETEDEMSEVNVATIQGYLSSYQQKYQFDSVFFVSEKTGAYYHYEKGIDRMMVPENPENDWYYDFLKDPNECALNVDNDEAKEDEITIFVNCKLTDKEGNILGVVGVGMETPAIQHFLTENEIKYDVHAYLIDVEGKVQLSSGFTEFEGVNLFEMDAYKGMKTAIISRSVDGSQRWFHSKLVDGYVISKYIPGLNWYLVVGKSTVDFKNQMLSQFFIGMLFTILVVTVVVLIVSRINKKNKLALIHLAQIDHLTKVKNRTGYALLMKEYASRLDSFSHFAIGLFDLNDLKKFNDLYGHQVGDACLRTFAEILSATFKNSDVFRIGGDEFALIFVNISEEEMLQDRDRFFEKIKAEKIGDIPIGAAFGYAFYDKDRFESLDALFKAADNNMYLDKINAKDGQEENLNIEDV